MTRIGKHATLCAALTLLLFSDGVAEKKGKVSYWDIFSLKIDRRDSWSIENLGFNLSRYFEIGNNNHLIFPGVGIRTKVGENPKIEMFPKLAIAGIVGLSAGGLYGSNGLGFGTSLWMGLGVVGVEYSSYSDRMGVDQEISIYVAYQFGSGSKGEYQFGNILHDLASAFP